ncbi:hypothetical protein PUN28_003632 [Cardiocondyla obscurior]|uniref:Uncharacterized protein n=1 Tax=Cardiocondyla obscurior TaxID=286306 RepID=A0AAW2GLN8_9HYME
MPPLSYYAANYWCPRRNRSAHYNNSDIFVHIVIELLNPRFRRGWETLIGCSAELSTYDDLKTFLERQIHTLDALKSSAPETATQSSKSVIRTSRSYETKTAPSPLSRTPLFYLQRSSLHSGMFRFPEERPLSP